MSILAVVRPADRLAPLAASGVTADRERLKLFLSVAWTSLCRGALDGLIAAVVEGHIREHVIGPEAPRNDARAQAAEEVVEIVHSFLT